MKTRRRVPRPTFAEVLQDTRRAAGQSAWKRAQFASRLRHLALAENNHRAARAASRVKRRAILHVRRLLPECLRICPDDRFGQATFRVVFPGHGALHLPFRLLEGVCSS